MVVLFINIAYSKENNINLNSSINETNVTYDLVYNGEIIEDGSTVNEINILAPLTYNGNTNIFLIYASSNMNNALSIDVDINPESFKTTLNNDENDIYDSQIIPNIFVPFRLANLPAGKNEDRIVYTFILFWQGKKNLPAGHYVSNVSIEYSIQ